MAEAIRLSDILEETPIRLSDVPETAPIRLSEIAEEPQPIRLSDIPEKRDVVGNLTFPIRKTAELLQTLPGQYRTALVEEAKTFKERPFGAALGIGLNALAYLQSPVEAGMRGLLTEPLEQATGIPEKITTPLSFMAIPALGMTKRAQQVLTPTSKAVLGVPDLTKPVVSVEQAAQQATKTAASEEPFVAGRLLGEEVKPQVHQSLTLAAKDFFAQNPHLLDPDPANLISDQMVTQYLNGNITAQWLRNYGVSVDQFLPQVRKSLTHAARSMAYYANIAPRILKESTPQELEALKAAGMQLDTAEYIRPLWKEIDDIRRALLVTQPATAVRNAITQAGRVGLDVIQAPIDAGLQKAAGVPQTIRALDGLDEALQIFRKNKDASEKILSAFPQYRRKLFATYFSDIPWDRMGVRGEVLQKGKAVADTLNILNRSQEFIFRRAVFQARLAQELRNVGINLDDAIRANKIMDLPEPAIAKATEHALEITFAQMPEQGTVGRAFVDFVNRMPGATLAIPFPRFLTNALRMQYEYSPLGILSYLSPTERAAFAAGNTAKVSKAIIGSGMLGAAMLFRNSEYAGEKWYEAKTAEGKIIDLRPYNPFASYLFLADVAKRSKDRTLHQLTAKDITMGVLASNLRAGTGLYLLDSTLNLFSDASQPDKVGRLMKELAGNTLAGFLVPLAPVRDLYDEITAGESIARDVRQEPFLGPIKRQIPGLSQTLPETISPVREGPLVTESPLLRQATGLIVRPPKRPAEAELDRLGFSYQEIFKSTGEPDIDRKYKEVMSPVADRILNALVSSPQYKTMNDSAKGVVLDETLKEVREVTREAAKTTLTQEQLLTVYAKTLSPRIRRLLKESGLKLP